MQRGGSRQQINGEGDDELINRGSFRNRQLITLVR
jgi:hypothetical protein